MPMPRCREAPQFGQSASEFNFFFEDVEELAQRASLDVAKTIKWACRYAGAESESWQYVPCLQNHQVPTSFSVFRREVMEQYPHLSEDDRYTIDDLEKLVQQTARFLNMSCEDFGKYNRTFITYSGYLIKRDLLSLRKRNSLFIRGLPEPLHTRVLRRLYITNPDVLPRVGYCYSDIYDATLFVLSPDIFEDLLLDPPEPSPSRENVQTHDLLATLIQALTSFVQFQSYQPPSPPAPHPPPPVPNTCSRSKSQAFVNPTPLQHPRGPLAPIRVTPKSPASKDHDWRARKPQCE